MIVPVGIKIRSPILHVLSNRPLQQSLRPFIQGCA